MATPTCPIAKGSSNLGVTESVRAAAGSTAGAAEATPAVSPAAPTFQHFSLGRLA